MTTNGLEITEQIAAQLLDFNNKLDIPLLESVVNCMYADVGMQQKRAEQILTALKEHKDAWTRVDAILEYSSNAQTKFFALQILENVIKYRWKVIPREQCNAIREYIVRLIIETSSNADSLAKEEVLLGKLNMILVQIVKHEWPKNWPSFISDIVGSSKTNEHLCQNNMVILKLLSEEVFEFSIGQMTLAKTTQLRDTMCSEFLQIFQLCEYILDVSGNGQLVYKTLETLLRFMHWIPLGFVFQTSLINRLVNHLLPVPAFRNVTIQVLIEIVGISTKDCNDQFVTLFTDTTSYLKQMIPLDTNIKEAYKAGLDSEQKLIQNLALFYQTLLSQHIELIEKNPSLTHLLQDALQYLLKITQVDEIEVKKICLEFWNFLVADLYDKSIMSCMSMQLRSPNNDSRLNIYSEVLSKLRVIVISEMARPEEVLVVENEQGEVVREFMKDTVQINLYKSMRQLLVYLTHLSPDDTESIMLEKLARQMNGSEWSWKNINTLSWAIGSISGTMDDSRERKFLVIVIRDLLALCEQKRAKDSKAIVASDIMYVVSQYPKFLLAHWRFLKTVNRKLFEFMHESHEGVPDMAVDSFYKIATKCKQEFVIRQEEETESFAAEIIANIGEITCDLEPQQMHLFYESLGLVIGAESSVVIRDNYIIQLFALPNQVWNNIIERATADIQIFRNIDVVKQVVNILRTNYRVCKALGAPYLTQLKHIYMDMLNVYKVVSEDINQVFASHGESSAKQPIIRQMKAVKKETLRVISTWVEKSVDVQMVCKHFVPPLLDAVLLDYQRNIAVAREPEVLNCMATIINHLEHHIKPHIDSILEAVFQSTLEMINKDMQEFPEHRSNFFTLLLVVIKRCFVAFFSLLATENFKPILDSIIWAIKHTMRQVAETGLKILHTLLLNVSNCTAMDIRQGFYKKYYLQIVHHIFSVVTDSSYAANQTAQCNILRNLMNIVEQGTITVSLSCQNGDSSTLVDTKAHNISFVQHSLAELLKQAYPHLQDTQIRLFVEGLFSFNANDESFQVHIRDLLIQIKQHAEEDLSDLFIEEREKSLKEAQEAKQKQLSKVGGMFGPHFSSAMGVDDAA